MRATAVCSMLSAIGCSYAPTRTPDNRTADAPTTTADVAVVTPDAIDGPLPTGCDIVPTGLVACYQFEDDFAGNLFTDGSGNALNATASNSPR
jgi:hypothetical protein